MAPRLSVERREYWVAGSTAAQLRSMVGLLGPSRGGQSFGAYTDWEVSWSYEPEPVASGHRVAAADVSVCVTITLPRWSAPPTAAAALVAEWEEYVAALEDHELGHRDLALSAGRAVEEAILALSPFPSGEQLAAAVNTAAQGAVSAARARERAYDEHTRHGLARGVKLPGRGG
jgi:predicted secreted Zn-dependent protease